MKKIFLYRIFFFYACLFLHFSIHGESLRYIELVDSADYYINREMWEEAEKTIISALRQEPANFSNHLLFSNLGVVRTNLGKDSEALEAFGLGLSLAPNSTVLLNNRSRTYITIGKNKEALEDLNKSLSLDSIQEWPLQMRGLMLLGEGKNEDAKENFLFLHKHFPKNEISYLGLGEISESEGKDDIALNYYKEGLNINENEELYSAYILLKIKQENYSEASEKIRECISKFPQNPIFYVLRGYLHKLNYRYEEAEADKKIAISKGASEELINRYLNLPRR